MIVGYARTSTAEQKFGLMDQLDKLHEMGCEKIFQEQISSASKRTELDKVIDFVREGDVLVVTKLDRLARSVSHLWSIVDRLSSKGVSLKILNIALDTETATGKLMLSLLGAVAEFEREIMLERQKDGIAKALQSGRRFGRKPSARNLSSEIQRLKQSGMGVAKIAEALKISRASVYRYA